MRRTISRHVGWQMAKWIALIFSVFVFLMMVFDFTQIAQWVGVAFDLGTALMLSAMRGPGIAETILPFAVLFAAMAAFFQMNRRLELTVTRAAGLSAWQVLIPASIVALLVGIAATTLYNPGAAALRERSVEIGGFGLGNIAFNNGGEVWLRQTGRDGTSILGAESAPAAAARCWPAQRPSSSQTMAAFAFASTHRAQRCKMTNGYSNSRA